MIVQWQLMCHRVANIRHCHLMFRFFSFSLIYQKKKSFFSRDYLNMAISLEAYDHYLSLSIKSLIEIKWHNKIFGGDELNIECVEEIGFTFCPKYFQFLFFFCLSMCMLNAANYIDLLIDVLLLLSSFHKRHRWNNIAKILHSHT